MTRSKWFWIVVGVLVAMFVIPAVLNLTSKASG